MYKEEGVFPIFTPRYVMQDLAREKGEEEIQEGLGMNLMTVSFFYYTVVNMQTRTDPQLIKYIFYSGHIWFRVCSKE